MVHYRYSQHYKGYPVEGGVYHIHARDGLIASANGVYYPNIQLDITRVICEEEALSLALAEIDADMYRWELTGEEAPSGGLVVLPLPTGEYIFCWKFDIYAIDPLSRDYVFINAATGTMEQRYTRMMTFDVPGTVNTHYSGVQNITSESHNGSYRLRQSGRGNGIITYNMQNGMNHQQAIDFTGNSPNWDSLSTLNRYALDAHYATEMYWDYNYHVQGRNSLDNNGFVLKSYVHFGNAMTNAFWDGQGASFGDGSGNFSPLVSMEIVGHEFTHGLIEHTAGLVNTGESYALNESFCDIFGVVVERYAHPSEPDSLLFLIGEKVTQGGIRNMADPNSKSQASTYKGNYWDPSDAYACGAVQSYWFYLLSNGGSGVNDNNDTFNVNGIGFDYAADIAYRALTVYLTPTSDFFDARFYSIQSAIDIFGTCSEQLKQTINAWHAVGVGDPWADSLVVDFTWDKVPCSNPVAIRFINHSNGMAHCTWDFGDGNSSALVSPTHLYASNGNYIPRFTAVGCDGNHQEMTLTIPIEIDNSQVCDSVNIPLNSNTVVHSCEGVLFDSGGKDNNYVSGNTGSLTIQAPAGSKIKIHFLSFDLAPFTDQVQIFDGHSTSSPLIKTFNFMTAPEEPVYSSGNAITIQESYDTFWESMGFEIYYSCLSTVGMEKTEAPAKMVMYPNPASNQIFFSGIMEQARIEIYSMTGQLLVEDRISSGSERAVNTSSLLPGMYVVNAWHETGNEIFKLIIE